MGCTRMTLIIINSAFLLAGILLVILATLGLTEVLDEVPEVAGKTIRTMVYHFPGVDYDDVFDDGDSSLDEYDAGYIILYVAGAVFIIMGGLGMIGSVTGSGWFLVPAFILQVLVLLVALAIGIALPVYAYVKTEEDTNSDEKIKQLYLDEKEYVVYDNKTANVLIYWNDLQEDKQCCGYETQNDYNNGTSRGDDELPRSCCGQTEDGGFLPTCTPDFAYEKPCKDEVDDWLWDNVYIRCIVCLVIGIAVSFIMIIAQILTCLVMRKGKSVKSI